MSTSTRRGGTRRARLTEVRREHVLDAARRVFAARGYEAATMEQIARQAAYTKRTLYAYFSSKETLLLEVCASALERMVPLLQREAVTGTTGAERLSRIGMASLAFFTSDPAALTVFGQNPPFAPRHLTGTAFRRVKALNVRLHAIVAEAFEIGISDGTVRPDVEPRRAALFVTHATAALMQSVAGRGALFQRLHDVPPDEIVTFGLRMIGQSFLAGHGGGPRKRAERAKACLPQ